MVTYLEQIKEFEDEIRKTSYNKRTQHHIGLVKAKIAHLKDKQVARGKGKGKTEGYNVKKSGDATVALIGFPSVGKSTLLNRLTNAASKTAGYAFTTLTCIPGVMHYQHAKIQILDLPGILQGAAAGTGRGKEVISVLRNADLVLFVIDIFEPTQLKTLQAELYDAGLRLNEQSPDVTIKKTMKGGVQVATTRKLKELLPETIQAILNEFKMTNAYVLIRDDIGPEQLIDVIEGNKHYIPAITVLNKTDLADKKMIKKTEKVFPDSLFISAERSEGLERLKQTIFDRLQLIRIYLKEIGKKADMEEPIIMKTDSTVQDVCEKLHRDFVSKFRFARVWGKSAKFPGQKFTLKHVLHDSDVVEIRLS